MIAIMIPGAPVAKGRPRISTRGGFARAYTPGKTQRYEDLIRLEAGRVMSDRSLMEGSLVATIAAYVPIPTSMSKKRHAMATAGEIRATTRPDLDNYIKCIDALNGIVFRDDSQIVELRATKHYSDQPRLEVTLQEAGR
mgnify:CR=1 FL=1